MFFVILGGGSNWSDTLDRWNRELWLHWFAKDGPKGQYHKVRTFFPEYNFYFYIIHFDSPSFSSHYNRIVLLPFLEMQHLNLKSKFVQPCLSLNVVVWKKSMYFPFVYESSANQDKLCSLFSIEPLFCMRQCVWLLCFSKLEVEWRSTTFWMWLGSIKLSAQTCLSPKRTMTE